MCVCICIYIYIYIHSAHRHPSLGPLAAVQQGGEDGRGVPR